MYIYIYIYIYMIYIYIERGEYKSTIENKNGIKKRHSPA